MPDKLFNVYNQFSTVAISTQTNKEKLKKKQQQKNSYQYFNTIFNQLC